MPSSFSYTVLPGHHDPENCTKSIPGGGFDEAWDRAFVLRTGCFWCLEIRVGSNCRLDSLKAGPDETL
jgi:hypothetical protein